MLTFKMLLNFEQMVWLGPPVEQQYYHHKSLEKNWKKSYANKTFISKFHKNVTI